MASSAQTWSQTIDNVFTTTWAYRKAEVTEQAYLKTPLIYWLKEKGRVLEISGHRRIEIPVEYGDNETARWISKGSTVPITDSELVTMAYDDWKYISVSIVRWFQDDQQNRSKAALYNLVQLKLNAAERALYEELERVCFADGTGANEPNGMQNIIAADPTTGSLHGISRATYTWWRNQVKSATGAAGLYLLTDMSNALNNILRYARSEVKDIIIITDQTSYELFEQEGFERVQLAPNKLLDMGFDALSFRGRPVTWMPSAPSGKMYFINPNYLKLVVDPSYWMDMTEWKPIVNQPHDRAAQIVCAVQMICTRPVCQLVLTGIAA